MADSIWSPPTPTEGGVSKWLQGAGLGKAEADRVVKKGEWRQYLNGSSGRWKDGFKEYLDQVVAEWTAGSSARAGAAYADAAEASSYRQAAGLLHAMGLLDSADEGKGSTKFSVALANYQRIRHINAGNGILDTETLADIDKSLRFLGGQSPENHTTAAPAGGGGPRQAPAGEPFGIDTNDRASVSRMQQRLRDEGFNPGPIDGLWGPRTQAAYDQWKNAGGMVRPADVMREMAGSDGGSTPGAVGGVGGSIPTTSSAGGGVASIVSSPSTTAKVTTAPGSPEALKARILKDFPAFSYLLDEPELATLFQEAVTKGYTTDQFAVRLFGTNWWKTHSEFNRKWDALTKTDPAQAKARLDAMVVTIDNKTMRLGIKLSDVEAQTMADSALRFGWTQEQIDRAVAKQMQARDWGGGLPTGEASYNADQLGQLAANFGIRVPRTTLEQYAIGIAAGTSSAQSFQSYVTKLAKEKWNYDPDVIAAIDQGITPKAFFAPHQQAIADLLELSPDQVDVFNDPTFQAVTQFVDPATGKRRGMTEGEAKQLARNDPRFKKTAVFTQGAAELATNLLKWTGKVAA